MMEAEEAIIIDQIADDGDLPIAMPLHDDDQGSIEGDNDNNNNNNNNIAAAHVRRDAPVPGQEAEYATSFLYGMLQDDITCTSVLGWGAQACSRVVERCTLFPDDVSYHAPRTGRTVLHEACFRCSCLHIIRAILAVNATSVMALDSFSNSPLHLLLVGVAGHALDPKEMGGIIDALLSAENAAAVASIGNRDGNSPLHMVCLAPESMIPLDCCLKILNACPQSAARLNNLHQTPLSLHCQRRGASKEVAQKLIEAYPNAVTILDGSGKAPIHYAADFANHDLIQLLLETNEKAAGLRTTTHLETPLHLLCRKNVGERHIPSIECLLRSEPMAVLARDTVNNFTALHLVCRSPRVPSGVVECLLEFGTTEAASVRDCNNYLPIHHACEFGASTEVIAVLSRAYPAGATALTKKNDSALSLACACNKSTDTVALLIRANPRALTEKNHYGFVPLHCVCGAQQPRMGIVDAILVACPDCVAMKSHSGETPLHMAVGNPGTYVGVIELLTAQYEKNTNLNARDALKENRQMTNKVGNTPLHNACFRGSPFEHIETLAMSNPQWVKRPNNASYTPLQIMCKNGRLQDRVITTFSRIGGTGVFSVVDSSKNTPLHSAIREETDIEALRCLIRAFPDALRMKTTYGDTPLHLACFRRVDPEVVREVALSSSLLTPNTAGQTPISIAMEEFEAVCRRTSCCCSVKSEFNSGQKRAFHVLATLVRILHYGSSHDDRDRSGSLVRACVSLHRRDVRLDPAFIRRALHSYPEEARIVDDDKNYPLHIEASIPIEKMSLLDASSARRCSGNCHKRMNVLRMLFEIYPDACKVQNEAGEFPLNLMVQNGRQWDQTFALVLKTFPQALHWSMNGGVNNKITPRVLAKVSRECGVGTLYALISSKPDIVMRGTP